jgi:Glycosyltransferase WbsX
MQLAILPRSKKRGAINLDFLSFFYPGFSLCPVRNAAAGKSINEWDLLRLKANSWFNQERWREPHTGFQDSASPSSIYFDIGCCETYGVDALVFNYYFDGTRTELVRPLEQFILAPSEIRFAINICCRMSRRQLPFGLNPGEAFEPTIVLSREQYQYLISDLCDRYFRSPRYYRWNGKALVCFYHVEAFIDAYGRNELSCFLGFLKRQARERDIELHLVGLLRVFSKHSDLYNYVGGGLFDAISFYATGADFSWERPVQNYSDVVSRWTARWADYMEAFSGAVHLCVGTGWNATPRGMAGYNPFLHGFRFPYVPVVTEARPDKFRIYLENMVDLSRTHGSGMPLFLGPWNEWSEGCNILPDTIFQWGWLDAVRDVKSLLCTIPRQSLRDK